MVQVEAGSFTQPAVPLSKSSSRVQVDGVAGQFPDIALDHGLVDSFAMQLVQNPARYDVILAGNLFGDILSDLAAVLAGSLGMLPSASLGEGSFGLYEPVHGSAPDLAGLGVANPIGAILSIAMLLRHSLGLDDEAEAVERAVTQVLGDGLRTGDLIPPGAATRIFPAGTHEVTTSVVRAMVETGAPVW